MALKLASVIAAIAVVGVASLRVRAAAAQEVAPPRLGGYVQVRSTAQERVGFTTFINRARLSAEGQIPTRFSYRLLIEYEASAGRNLPAMVSLREAMIRWQLGSFTATAGQLKVPFSKEYLIPVPNLETADFAAVVDSLAPKYDLGLQGDYAVGPYGNLILGVFNGEGQNSIANRDSVVMAVARAVVRPVAQLALGANATRDGADSLRWGVEGTFETWGAMVRSEYITRHRRGRDRADDDFGWYVLGGLRVVPLAQLLVRVEDFQRPAYGAARRVRGPTLGVNLDLVPSRVRLLIEGVRKYSGARSVKTEQLLAQLQARF